MSSKAFNIFKKTHANLLIRILLATEMFQIRVCNLAILNFQLHVTSNGSLPHPNSADGVQASRLRSAVHLTVSLFNT